MPPVSASQRTIQPFHALLCAAEPLGTETSEISGMRIVELIRIALAAPMLAASLKTAVFVGLILNLVNHGSDLLHGRPVSAWHVFLNFVVPFCVSSYSAARHEIGRRGSDTGN
jgi:hypothetical protein